MGNRINFFPSALPDETLHSRIARYHLLSGNLDDRLTLRELFDSHILIVTSLIPSHLAVLRSRLPEKNQESIESLQENCTLFPYYHPFLDERRISTWTRASVGMDARNIKISLGLVASRLGGSNPFRYCERCAEEEIAKIGIAYWHRLHQLPGVLCCEKHLCPLYVTDAKWVSLMRQRLFLPSDVNRIGRATSAEYEAKYLPTLLKVATLSEKLLEIGSDSMAPISLRYRYLNLADRRGWLLRSGRVRSSAIDDEVARLKMCLPLHADFNFLHQSSSRWMLGLLRKERKFVSPLQHLMLLLSLEGDWGAVFTNLSIDSSPGRKLKLDGAKIVVGKKLAIESSMRKTLNEGGSLRAISRDIGISVTTLKVQAQRLGLSLSLRPKVMKSSKLEEIRNCLRSTMPLSEIAIICRVSVVSLYRVLRSDPALASEREEMKMCSHINVRRARFLEDVSSCAPRDTKDYMWLYRNDSEWLRTWILDSKKERPAKRIERVKWRERDENFANQVPAIAEELYNLRPPRRVSRTSIIRVIGRQALIEKSWERLPLTAEAIAQVVEHNAAFSIRRKQCLL